MPESRKHNVKPQLPPNIESGSDNENMKSNTLYDEASALNTNNAQIAGQRSISLNFSDEPPDESQHLTKREVENSPAESVSAVVWA